MNLVTSAQFLRSLGVPIVQTMSTVEKTFLKGIWINDGKLFYNPSLVRFTGDLFHEAGHFAIMPGCLRHFLKPGSIGTGPEFRKAVDKIFKESEPDSPVVKAILQSSECEAIAWSYAAAHAAGMSFEQIKTMMLEDPTAFVGSGKNDPDDTEGRSSLVYSVASGNYFGVYGLQASGMTTKKMWPTMKIWMQP